MLLRVAVPGMRQAQKRLLRSTLLPAPRVSGPSAVPSHLLKPHEAVTGRGLSGAVRLDTIPRTARHPARARLRPSCALHLPPWVSVLSLVSTFSTVRLFRKKVRVNLAATGKSSR